MKKNDEKNPRKAHAACSKGEKKLFRGITDTRNLRERKNENILPESVGKQEANCLYKKDLGDDPLHSSWHV